ncbi:MAG: class I SAM-dependent rRNA methyltransferase, partial [Crenarchaeota archaeon]|nr:class I SAM-dependent rRNA methyltransferase [Thermoproteota archaeon]
DEDPWALRVLRENLRLNGFEEGRVEVVRSDAWKYFSRAKKKGKQFDVGSVDPPALMDDYRDGYVRYVKAYSGAASITRTLLSLSSCSRSMDRDTFVAAIHDALAPNYRILEIRGSAPDHSIRKGLPDYLKNAFVYLA